VYAHTHVDLPLDYRVFLPILEKLRYAIENNMFLQEEVGIGRIKKKRKVFFHHLFFSSTHNDNAYYVMTETLLPGGIRTRDLLFCRRTPGRL
jgi:hypothetical protein